MFTRAANSTVINFASFDDIAISTQLAWEHFFQGNHDASINVIKDCQISYPKSKILKKVLKDLFAAIKNKNQEHFYPQSPRLSTKKIVQKSPSEVPRLPSPITSSVEGSTPSELVETDLEQSHSSKPSLSESSDTIEYAFEAQKANPPEKSSPLQEQPTSQAVNHKRKSAKLSAEAPNSGLEELLEAVKRKEEELLAEINQEASKKARPTQKRS